MIPLDVLRQVLFSPSDLLGLPTETRAGKFLRQIVPFGIAATSSMYGLEGFHLKDVAGIVAVSQPEALRTRSMRVDVETHGELTRGMSVFDQRAWQPGSPNVEVVVELHTSLIHQYINRILKPA
jgi:inosine-uridine nucleoside N-ribohydrolase